ncbi:MAG: hypothetical protein IJX40_05125 [Alistipes sp.]|nr:hypothetical protein [Alistipes sp.]
MLVAEEASAQIKAGEGQVSIALESNSTYYMEDKKLEDIGLYRKDDRFKGNFGSNDFLKVDYNLGRFSAGVQIDAYLPPLYGYDIYENMQRDSKCTAFFTKYVQWEDQNWGVRLGDIYDQFGNGILLRTYEDRALAFNNSLAGARAYYNFNNYATVKVLAGLPRLYDVRTKNPVWGADLSLSISDMAGWYDGVVSVEGSYVGRYQANAIETMSRRGIDSKCLNMVSGRVNFEYAGFTMRGEYATKLNKDSYIPGAMARKGNAVHIDLGYSYKRFSVTATFRRIEAMTTNIMISTENMAGGNLLNYLPVLTRQHTYSLAGLNPFMGSPSNNEVGGQVDVYYSLRNKKARGKYWNFHANFSMFNSLDHKMGNDIREGRNIWIDFNFDVERQWNKSVKTTFLYSYQRRDTDQYDTPFAHYCDAHIFVGDVTYKINKKHSLRFEAQYLAANDYEGDWVAATIEYNIAPMFSFYVSDMWNCEKMQDGMYGNYKLHQSTGKRDYELLHYYQIGTSFTYKSFRAQLSYGRNREGIVCSGGVCRKQPAFTGFNLALTLSF